MEKLTSTLATVLLFGGLIIAGLLASGLIESQIGSEKANDFAIGAIALWSFFKAYDLQRRLDASQIKLENALRRLARLERYWNLNSDIER